MSFKGAKQALTAFAPIIETAPPEDRAPLIDAMLRTNAYHRVGGRPGRWEPRPQKRRPKPAARLTQPRHIAKSKLAGELQTALGQAEDNLDLANREAERAETYDRFAQQNADTPRAAAQNARTHFTVALLQAALSDDESAEAATQRGTGFSCRDRRLANSTPVEQI